MIIKNIFQKYYIKFYIDGNSKTFLFLNFLTDEYHNPRKLRLKKLKINEIFTIKIFHNMRKLHKILFLGGAIFRGSIFLGGGAFFPGAFFLEPCHLLFLNKQRNVVFYHFFSCFTLGDLFNFVDVSQCLIVSYEYSIIVSNIYNFRQINCVVKFDVGLMVFKINAMDKSPFLFIWRHRNYCNI